MKLPFLDFYKQELCRTIQQIAETRLKDYGQLVAGQPLRETKQPLPYDVYIAFLERLESYTATASALSQQRQAYYNFMKEQLCSAATV